MTIRLQRVSDRQGLMLIAPWDLGVARFRCFFCFFGGVGVQL